MLLSDDDRLVIAKCCTVRRQVDHCLIYNMQTDELHVVPLGAAPVLAAFNGELPLAAIAEAAASASATSLEEARARVGVFADELVKRGVLVPARGDGNA